MASSHFSRNGSVFIFLSVSQRRNFLLFITLGCWRRQTFETNAKLVFINSQRQWPNTIEIRINLRAPFNVRSQPVGRRLDESTGPVSGDWQIASQRQMPNVRFSTPFARLRFYAEGDDTDSARFSGRNYYWCTVYTHVPARDKSQIFRAFFLRR